MNHYNLSGYPEYHLFPKENFKVKLGPYHRVQNVNQLMDYRNKSLANKIWVYDPQEGPFRALGHEKITKIVNKESPLDPILRLNRAISKLFQAIYNQIELNLENPKFPSPSLPVRSKPVLNINKPFDTNGRTPILHCIQLIVDKKTDLTAIDRFVKLGGDLNASIDFIFSGKRIHAPPLAYLMSLLGGMESLNSKLFQIMDHFIARGANLDHTFGFSEDNCVSVLIQAILPIPSLSPLSFVLYWYEKNGGNINFKNTFGQTFLHLTLENPDSTPPFNLYTATTLIEHGADVSEPCGADNRPIHLLCEHGYNDDACTRLLKTLLEKAPAELNARGNCGFIPLYLSIRTGKQLFIDVLLEAKPKVSLLDAIHCLYAFAHYVGKDCRKAKWAGGQQIFSKESIENKLKETHLPLLKSILPLLYGSVENLRALMIKEEREIHGTFLHDAASKSPWILDCFLEEGYILPEDLQLKNEEGITVDLIGTKTNNSFLMLEACYHLDRDLAEQLLKKDICLNLCIDGEKSLLHIILDKVSDNYSNANDDRWENGFPIFKKLLAKGMNPNLQNSRGKSPLLQAINIQNSLANPFILELLDWGADADLADKEGMTPRIQMGQTHGWEIIKNAVLGAPVKPLPK